MLKTTWCIAGAIGIALSTSAHAEEHSVVMTGFSYFPAVIYAEPGDTIRFINESGSHQTVVGASGAWFAGPLNDLGEVVITIETESDLVFYAATQNQQIPLNCYNQAAGQTGTCGNGNGSPSPDIMNHYGQFETAPVRAEVTFDEPPLS